MKPLSKVMKNPSQTKEILSFSFQEIFSGRKDQSPRKRSDASLTVSEKNTTVDPSDVSEENDSKDSEKNIRIRLAALEKEAYEKGFSEGEEAGKKSGIEAGAPNRQKLAALIEEIKYLKERILKTAENDILDIALSIAKNIIRQTAEQNSEGILHVIRKGIHKIGASEEIRIRLHPHDLEMITQEVDPLTTLLKDKGKLEFEADFGLSPGDCIIEGPKRMLDGRLNSQFSIIEEVIREERQN